MGTIYKKKDSL